ncbi:MAG: hypothetical protein JWO36_5960 [Myxococcales bacterium]|nr:hypothetical protein [Myxococcales bacterium]
MRAQLENATDEWFESEESTRASMIREVQRIRRRTRVRPIPVLLLAIAITGLITWKIATRQHVIEAEVVLLLTEGSLSAKHNGIPVEELREYVANVLLPNDKLAKLIEEKQLFKLRTAFTMQDAIKEVREQIDIQIWKNSFVYFDEDASSAEHSARIGITFADTDADRVYVVARELGQIIVRTATENRQEMSKLLAANIVRLRDQLSKSLQANEAERAAKQLAVTKARADHKPAIAEILNMQIAELVRERKSLSKQLADIVQSRDAVADKITEAGLDMSLTVVEERPPDRPEHHTFAMMMMLVVVAVGALLGSALLMGAFDSRVHDIDDVERLGLPVLGHVPAFPGDEVGSLTVRGASRARVPLFKRWRSHR